MLSESGVIINLIAVSIPDKYWVGPSIRPFCTRCGFTMTDMILVVNFVEPEYFSQMLVRMKLTDWGCQDDESLEMFVALKGVPMLSRCVERPPLPIYGRCYKPSPLIFPACCPPHTIPEQSGGERGRR